VQLQAVLAGRQQDPVPAELRGHLEAGQLRAAIVGDRQLAPARAADPAEVGLQQPPRPRVEGQDGLAVGPRPPPAPAALGREPAGAELEEQVAGGRLEVPAEGADGQLPPARQVVVERGREEAQVRGVGRLRLHPGHVRGVDEQVVLGGQPGDLGVTAVR
jgi:hypothetical protein